MKQKLPLVIAALLTAALLAACEGINTSSGPCINVYGGSSPPKVGDKLRAFSSGGEFTGDFIWEWAIKRDTSRWYEITVLSDEYPYNYGTLSGENDKEFTIGEGLADFYLRVRRKTKATDNKESTQVYSDVLGRIRQQE
jgi:hypothetical protein